MGAVAAVGLRATVGAELQILVVRFRRLQATIFGPVLQRCEGCQDLGGVDLHASIKRRNAALHPPIDVRLGQPAETDEHIDGTDVSPFRKEFLSDPCHSCFKACHNNSTLLLRCDTV